MNDVGWLLSMALVSCVSFYLGVGFGSSTVSQTSPIVLSDTPARSEGPIKIQSNTVPLTNITGGNIPSELTEIRSHFYAMITNPTSEAAGSLDAAYFHMLQIRAGANFHRFGSTGSFHSQWQTNYWKTREQFIQGKVKTVCEAGLGSGHSGIALLTATTNSNWYSDGAQFHSFDNGLKNEPEKKVAAFNYMTSTFGGRVHFHFGPQSSEEVRKWKEKRPDFLCDIVHIDADHKTAGVMKDIDAMHEVSHAGTVLLMDDYNIAGIKNAISGKQDKVKVDTIYSQEGVADWMILSAEQKQPQDMKKVYVVGHFVHNTSYS